jgi:hypothetical protein
MSSGLSSELPRTVGDGVNSFTSSSDLSALSLSPEERNDVQLEVGETMKTGSAGGKGPAKGKKRIGETDVGDAPQKKVKVEEGGPKERGIYCHQWVQPTY